MKSFKQYTEACWTGYTAKGMKKKGNRMVPNCVPEESELEKKASKYDFTKTKSGKPVPKQTKPFRMGNEPISNIKEDGIGGGGAVATGPTNVTGVATSTDPASATAVNRKKKRSPILMRMATRKAPK